MKDMRIAEALRHLDPQPGVKLWHGGATLSGSLRGVTPETASWKPAADRHSIWELTLHIAYWNYAVERRIRGTQKGSFPRSPSNWPDAPREVSESTWSADKQLLATYHKSLVEAIADFPEKRLDEVAGDKGKTTYADLITGIVLHDTYHIGQIQLMKRLAP